MIVYFPAATGLRWKTLLQTPGLFQTADLPRAVDRLRAADLSQAADLPPEADLHQAVGFANADYPMKVQGDHLWTS